MPPRMHTLLANRLCLCNAPSLRHLHRHTLQDIDANERAGGYGRMQMEQSEPQAMQPQHTVERGSAPAGPCTARAAMPRGYPRLHMPEALSLARSMHHIAGARRPRPDQVSNFMPRLQSHMGQAIPRRPQRREQCSLRLVQSRGLRALLLDCRRRNRGRPCQRDQ